MRYGLGGAMVLAGIVMIALNPGGFGVDGFAMAVGGGPGAAADQLPLPSRVSGDAEREREEEARRYLDEHGVWPDEDDRPVGRRWTLAPGVVTAEAEEAGRGARARGREPRS